MTEEERAHRKRMIRHAEKVRRNMENLRQTNEPLTPEELANSIKDLKKRHPHFFPAHEHKA